jgi:hypothetical protein
MLNCHSPQKKRSIVDRLLDHYKTGKGKPYCLSDSDFVEIINNARPTGAASVPHRDGSGNRVLPVSFYRTPLENAFGNAALIVNRQGGRVGFHDLYDFNASSHRSIIAEALTFVGSQIQGMPFSVDFNNRSCGGAD